MKKNIVGIAVAVLMVLGVDSLKADNTAMDNENCFPFFEGQEEDLGRNKANKKITFVNNIREGVYFRVVFEYVVFERKDEKDQETMFYLPANTKKILPYCAYFYEQPGENDPVTKENALVKSIDGYLLKRDFHKPGINAYNEKIKPLDLTATFKKLSNKKSFNLVITINDMNTKPVIEIKE